MEENTNMTEQTQAENMGTESETQGAAGKEGKLFTQEEVNGFVQSRIARMKSQLSKEAQAEYSQKLAELEAREMKLIVRERLSDRGMPKELADIITCVDEKDIDSKLDALQKIYGDKAKKEEKPTGFVQIVGARPAEGNTRGGLPSMVDPVRNAMGLN
ncbi:hypothetical protein [Clostridium porci]|uniref:DUF4355 domain-containing protein n=1 Tax=Clostridium porci TaxID=2605778 RepID=A0A7X2NKH5_9CLOT|nr:hypothetical protein [Clostridium porci]MSS35968.1 hypothetical protein [Clostridium porci]